MSLFLLWLGMFASHHLPDLLMLFAIICCIIVMWKTLIEGHLKFALIVILNFSSKKEKLNKADRTEQAIYSS